MGRFRRKRVPFKMISILDSGRDHNIYSLRAQSAEIGDYYDMWRIYYGKAETLKSSTGEQKYLEESSRQTLITLA